MLCLSGSSPFWVGRETGLKSYRSIIFRNIHRSGIPPQFDARADFDRMVELMVKTGCIPDGSKIYWDLRPHHRFPTLEFRISDCCTRVEEAACVGALFQAIVAKLWKLRRDGAALPVYPAVLIEENKWRAVRHGLDGNLVDFRREVERPAREMIRELIEDLGDVVDELGSRSEIDYAYRIMEHGSSADRQLATYRRTNDHTAVVDQLIAETEAGVK